MKSSRAFTIGPVVFALLVGSVLYGNVFAAQSTRPGMGAIPYSDGLGTGVTFRVWAPDATTVAVPGSFNGWNTTANFLTKETGTNGLWSGDISTARNGDQYKYFINGNLWKRDPRDRKVVNSAGNSIVYDPNAFVWSGDTRLPLNTSNLVIYEMHVGAFYAPISGTPGKFTNAIAKLDDLAALGVNAVELLPIMEFAGDYSWGYNPADPYAVENTGYGGPDGLKSFVKAAHQRGIRVLIDVVHNHYGSSDLDLWTFDTGASPSIYFYTAANICCTAWGGRPNYATEGVRSYIIDNFRMLMDECHVDGFRWDSVGAMRYYDPGHVNIPEADSLIQYINSTTIHSDHPGAISIAEDQSYGMNFDGEWAVSFGDTLINTMTASSDTNRDVAGLYGAMNVSGFSRVIYDETHDLVGALNGTGAQRLPYRIQSTAPTGYYARKRSMLAAAILMTIPGIPMIFMGQEMLTTQQFSDSTPMNWANRTNFSGVVNYYRDLIRLRRNLDGVSLGLTGPYMTSHVIDNNNKVLAFHRWGAGANDQVMVILNFANQTFTNYSITGFPMDGNWYVNLNSDSTNYSADFGNQGTSFVKVSGGNAQVTISPYSALILSQQALPQLNPPSKFIDIKPNGGQFALRWTGGQVYRQIIEQSSQPSGPWTPIFTNNPPTTITNLLNVTGTATNSYFRIRVTP